MCICKVGRPIDAKTKVPHLMVPVQFEDGSYSVLWSGEVPNRVMPQNQAAHHALKNSTKMPTVVPGDTDVIHIYVYTHKRNVAHILIQIFYDDKFTGNGDTYKEVLVGTRKKKQAGPKKNKAR